MSDLLAAAVPAAVPAVDLDAATLDAIQAQVDAGATTVLAEAHARGLSRKALSKRLSRRRVALGVESAPVAKAPPTVKMPPSLSPKRSTEWAENRASGTAAAHVRGAAEPPTEAGIIAAVGADLERWEPVKFDVSNWPLSYKDADGDLIDLDRWAGKLQFRRRVGGDSTATVRALLGDFVAAQPVRTAPSYPPIPNDGRHLLVIAPADLHYGMYSWGAETGVDYDSSIAASLAERAVADLLRKAAGFNVERILIPLGHDWFHADRTLNGAGGTTTKGTNVEVDDRWQRMFRNGHALAGLVIELCRERAAVEVVMVPGNHDEQTAFYLGEVMAARFARDEAVTICNDPAVRHYRRYGVNGLALMHGHRERKQSIPNLFAAEAPKLWAETTTREALTGHLHRAGMLMCEETGFVTWEMPSLAASDGWHAGMGYRHRQRCQSLLYHHDEGYAGGHVSEPPMAEWHWRAA